MSQFHISGHRTKAESFWIRGSAGRPMPKQLLIDRVSSCREDYEAALLLVARSLLHHELLQWWGTCKYWHTRSILTFRGRRRGG